MKNINQLINIVGQSHQHMPELLLFLLGAIVIQKPSVFFSDDNAIGDNVPATLIDSLRG